MIIINTNFYGNLFCLISGQIGFGIEIKDKEISITENDGATWHIMFIVYSTYAMFPLGLKWQDLSYCFMSQLLIHNT